MSLNTVYLGLGSNIDRERHICAALDALDALLVDMRCSPVFESQAVGIRSEPFFNLVVAGQTELSLPVLAARLKQIEADNGRYAEPRNGLPLDIDVLLYNDLAGNFDGILLPRAEILKNAFVLWPLAILAPDVIHPVEHKRFAELWQQSQIDQRLHAIPFTWKGRPLTPQ